MSPDEHLQSVIAELNNRAVVTDAALKTYEKLMESQSEILKRLVKSERQSTKIITILASLLIAQSMWILLH